MHFREDQWYNTLTRKQIFIDHHSFPCSRLWFQPGSPANAATLQCEGTVVSSSKQSNLSEWKGATEENGGSACSARALVEGIWQKSLY